jgi:hypothetical protein
MGGTEGRQPKQRSISWPSTFIFSVAEPVLGADFKIYSRPVSQLVLLANHGSRSTADIKEDEPWHNLVQCQSCGDLAHEFERLSAQAPLHYSSSIP